MLSLLENPSLVGDVPGPENMDGNNTRGFSGGIDLLTSGEDFGSSRGSILSLLNSVPGAEEASFFDDSAGSYLQDGVAESHNAAASVDSVLSAENLNFPQLKGFNGRIDAETKAKIRMDAAGCGTSRSCNGASSGLAGLNGRAANGLTSAAAADGRLCVESATAKVGKKRSRASRRAPTTVLTTDTSNFRAMVQEFTGIPSGPFSGALPFSRNGIDFLGARGLPAGSNLSNFLLARPFPPQMVGPSALPPKLLPRGVPPPDLLLQSLLRQQQQQQQHPPRDSISFPASNFANNIKAPPATGGLLEELGLNCSAAGQASPCREASLKSHILRDLLCPDKRPAQWSNACNVDWTAARNITRYNKAGGEAGERTKAMPALHSDERALDLQAENHRAMADREQVDSWISSTDQTLEKL